MQSQYQEESERGKAAEPKIRNNNFLRKDAKACKENC